MRCQRCFFENEDRAEFCSRCGDVIKKHPSQAKFTIRYRKGIVIFIFCIILASGFYMVSLFL